jgi:hypothetical protein
MDDGRESMAVTNVKTSDGVYTFTEFGNTYKYYASSRVLYMVTYFKGDPSYHFERGIQSDLEHQKLLDSLTGKSTDNPILPVVSNPPPRLHSPKDDIGLGPMNPPKYVPDPVGMLLGRVPQTVQYRVSGIGVVPSINPVVMDKSYRPKKFSFNDMPESPEELQEYISQVGQIYWNRFKKQGLGLVGPMMRR